ncbi:MAG TPA: AMP-binding protein [Mycobacteriales bacterium]|nr:AMP-binding protein [Mycobacteriales bacterium]
MPEGLPTVGGLVRARADDHRPGLRFEGRTWTWAEHTAEAAARAAWYAARTPHAAQPHVGVLLENVPEYSFWLAAAALGRFVVVGLNSTRQGEALAADVRSTACDLVLTDRPELFDGLDLGAAEVLDPHREYPPADLPVTEARPEDLYLLIFTSGTTGAPKAVRCSQGKIAMMGLGLVMRVGLTDQDTAYASMPLFHSNAIVTAWTPAMATGMTLALRRRFSASRVLDDCREVGATYANYVGTPLSYVLAQPERPDDADNPLVRVFGNEGAPSDLERFATRFGCEVIDGFGSTEGGLSITRTPDTPAGALGVGVGDVRVVGPDGEERPHAVLDEHGRLANPEEAVGELVNADGLMFFEGYWDAPEDTERRSRNGWYWSGDLGYRDADGFLWFAGRSLDRLRVAGENFPAAPVARLLTSHPSVVEAVVYAVPDPTAGDQVMAAVVPGEGFDPQQLLDWFAVHPDSAKPWVPRYVRVSQDLPRTATGKLVVRQLASRRWDGDDVWVRDGATVRPMTDTDRAALEAAFAASGRALP